jgi:hypothetical protein
MRDVTIALGVADGYGESLNRIRLQKFVYLMDAIAIIFRELPPSEGHYTFKHGPFDPAIQSAVDSLAFRGLVAIPKLTMTDEGKVSAIYKLSEGGKDCFTRMVASAATADRVTIAQAVATRVERLGWSRLRELVYAEPTFLKARGLRYGQKLFPYKGREVSTGRLLGIIRRALSAKGIEPSRDIVLDAYFEYLDKYARSQHQTAFAEAD